MLCFTQQASRVIDNRAAIPPGMAPVEKLDFGELSQSSVDLSDLFVNKHENKHAGIVLNFLFWSIFTITQMFPPSSIHECGFFNYYLKLFLNASFQLTDFKKI